MPFLDVSTTPRGSMTESRAVRLWEKHKGVCVLCHEPIDGTKGEWIIEHIRALGLGGSDADDSNNLGPAHYLCAEEKTGGPNGDLAQIAKAKRRKARDLGITAEVSPYKGKLQGRGFVRAPKQRTASNPSSRAPVPCFNGGRS